MSRRPPSYRLHKPSGQAVVTLNGKDAYLGRHDSPESKATYDRLIAEWLTRGRQGAAPTTPEEAASGAGLSVSALAVFYLDFAQRRYVKNGRPTSEAAHVRLSLRPLVDLYGPTPAAKFSPLKLMTVRERMIGAGLTREEINLRIGRIVRMFKRATSFEMTPPSVYQALATVTGLEKGRSAAKEQRKVRPVPVADVDAVLPLVPPPVAAMIRVQLHSAMRSDEVCSLKTGEIDRSSDVWFYAPASHKTDHVGKGRKIYFGPQAQAALTPWLRDDPDAYLFSPAEAEAARKAERRRNRKSKVPLSQANRAKRNPRWKPGARYTVAGYARAIKRACKRAGLKGHWFPHQLRHSAATFIRKKYGAEVTRIILNHSSLSTTEIYAEMDEAKAIQAMREIG